MIRRRLRRALGRARDLVLGPPDISIVDELIRRDRRWETFLCVTEYVNYEAVPGDILEFGVFTGKSLALFAKALSFDETGASRRLVGFDSFEGLGASVDDHARWRPGDCARSHGWHPLLREGDPVTPAATRVLFEACGLPAPELVVGPYRETVPATIGSKVTEAALVHVDCDLYEAARDVLFGIEPALQDGAMVLFDDWFHYKGDPNKGEARALREFLSAHPHWEAVHYRSYGVFCNAFIMHRRETPA